MKRLARPVTRRALLGSVLGLGAGLSAMSPLPAGAGRRRDRGIGGTGVIIEQPPEDRGIGGTGVIGTIREFGSIVVNEMHIAYPVDTEVEIDGRPATSADLRLGQIVHVVAEPNGAGFSTSRIAVANEVVGPIESVAKGELTVLGQKVVTAYIGDKGWRKGDWIAVSGLRNLDGAIVASLAKHSDASFARVAGPVRLASNGAPGIGGLTLANLDPSLAGRRVLAEVGRYNGAPVALKTIPDPELTALAGVSRLSVETYVVRSGRVARFGSGIVVSARSAPSGSFQGAPQNLPQGSPQNMPWGTPSGPVRAIVAVAVNPEDGAMTATGQKPAPPPRFAQPNLEPPKPAQSPSAQPGKPKATSPAQPSAAKAAPAHPNSAKAAAPAETRGAVGKPASTEARPAATKVEAPNPARAYTAPPAHVEPPRVEPPHYEPPLNHRK